MIKKILPLCLLSGALMMGGCASAPKPKAQSLSDRACAAIADKKFDKAQKLLEEALKANPKNAYAWLNMGVVHQHKKEYAEAKRCYLKVVDYAWDEKATNKAADGKSLIKMVREKLESLPDEPEKE